MKKKHGIIVVEDYNLVSGLVFRFALGENPGYCHMLSLNSKLRLVSRDGCRWIDG
jgi:hypothetical protein